MFELSFGVLDVNAAFRGSFSGFEDWEFPLQTGHGSVEAWQVTEATRGWTAVASFFSFGAEMFGSRPNIVCVGVAVFFVLGQHLGPSEIFLPLTKNHKN